MTNPAPEPVVPPANESLVRAQADQLRGLAARFGISHLRFACAGRLVGRVAQDRDALDVAEFEVAARQMLGAEVGLFSESVLDHVNVSPDLVSSHPL